MVHLSEADEEPLPFLLLLSTLEPFAGHRWTRQTSLTRVLEISLQDSLVSYPGDREHSREKQGHFGPYGVKACLGHSHVRKPENWGGGQESGR